jgi:predicted ABC-type sugar transport system permease subunit
MDYTNLENWMQLVVRGAVLVIAVAIDSASTMKHIWRSRRAVTGPPPPE